jgi:hypothetical protein
MEPIKLLQIRGAQLIEGRGYCTGCRWKTRVHWNQERRDCGYREQGEGRGIQSGERDGT